MPNYNDVFYKVADGLTLYARDYAGPAPDAPVVLCMHGLTRNSRDFARIAPTLARTHRVIVVEQRGRGRSEYDDQVERYVPATYMGDMFELLGELGINQCATIGTSMGGLMAMGMNALNPHFSRASFSTILGPLSPKRGLIE